MFPWCDTPTVQTPRYAVGEIIVNGAHRGRVVSVDAENQLLEILWSDADYGPIKYPMDAVYLTKAMPWQM